VTPYLEKIADGSLALVVADTLPVQMDQMKEGFSAGQVGQRPFQMGYEVMLAFQQLAEGGAAPEDPTYTGLDVCTPDTADSCIAQ
jgi:ribose transport system substrate-binding protein